MKNIKINLVAFFIVVGAMFGAATVSTPEANALPMTLQEISIAEDSWHVTCNALGNYGVSVNTLTVIMAAMMNSYHITFDSASTITTYQITNYCDQYYGPLMKLEIPQRKTLV